MTNKYVEINTKASKSTINKEAPSTPFPDKSWKHNNLNSSTTKQTPKMCLEVKYTTYKCKHETLSANPCSIPSVPFQPASPLHNFPPRKKYVPTAARTMLPCTRDHCPRPSSCRLNTASLTTRSWRSQKRQRLKRSYRFFPRNSICLVQDGFGEVLSSFGSCRTFGDLSFVLWSRVWCIGRWIL